MGCDWMPQYHPVRQSRLMALLVGSCSTLQHEVVELCVLLCEYAIVNEPTRKGHGSRCWLLVGNALKVSQTLGELSCQG
jgi:hypothetical protein